MSDAQSPSGTMLRRSLMLLIGCCGAAYIFPRYLGDMNFADGTSTQRPPAPRSGGIPVAEPPATESFRAQQGNQFYVTGAVNGTPIRFLVDTGATWVVLTQDDARLLGFNLANLNWDMRTRTANGIASNAAVTLDDIRLGRIVEYNVPAVVMRQSGVSLLGMSFLSRLRSWQISQGVLTIAS